MQRLQGKVALISGGARGMGAAHARAIVREGGSVVVGDVLDTEGKELCDELGNGTRFAFLDVRLEEDWAAAVELATATFGKLDVLVNNAGICSTGSLFDYSLDDWNRIIGINLTGQFLGMKASVAHLIAAAPSSIINISSTQGIEGIAALHGYTASKFGVRGLTKSAALELAGWNVRVNTICPGTIATPMNEGLDVSGFNPMNRKADPQEVSSLVVYLAGDESSFITGTEIVVDGGELAGHGPLVSN
ncbi:SDR family oxidoreductase [Pseudonocardia endophytica]|uniref:3alpha(Or 20beta)-hydroxysteroid dehydrogenase n=1 Tax=Pseudonocardia endophytica TaxID=401976 RepID=A0A4V2PHN3_PSEEN|nr:SDR family oxidoreductase [Pseudonocardia endophytica]TCK21416.1 3alpha(or 20beta)-hydroxysteroid dehydrogenase [Pseudonocardia endophytica]